MKKYKLLKDIPSVYKVGDIRHFEEWEPERFPDFFEPYVEWPKTLDELEEFNGYEILKSGGVFLNENAFYEKALFATKKHAESALAFAQLSQLAKAINEDWEPDYNSYESKYTVKSIYNILTVDAISCVSYLICLKTIEAAEFSLTHHKELWEKYWMI